MEPIEVILDDPHRGRQRIVARVQPPHQRHLDLDEIEAARNFDSREVREQALLVLIRELLRGASPLPAHLVEEARELGWNDDQLLEAIAFVSLESFTAMINVAGDVPPDGSIEESRTLRTAA